MTRDQVRRLVAEGLIGVAVCVGLSEGVVAPRRATLDAEQSAASGASATDGNTDLLRPEVRQRARVDLQQTGARLEQAARASAAHDDALVLFERLGVLAVEHGLEVQRLDEEGNPRATGGRATEPDSLSATPVASIRRTVTLALSGPFDRVARFLGVLGNDEHLTRIGYLAVRPDLNRSEPIVLAEVRLECFWLPTAEALRVQQSALAALDALEEIR